MFDLLHKAVIYGWFEKTQAQILQFNLDAGDAKPVCKRRIYLDGFFCDAPPLVLTHIFECPHIMQPVGKLNHDNSNILRHRKKHLAIVFKLYIFLGHIFNASKLRHTINECYNGFPKLLIHLLKCSRGILHDIMKQRCTYRFVIHMKCR